MSVFEKGTREKVRFTTSKGSITIEQAWDLSLTSLDEIARAVNSEIKASEEESFIGKKSTAAAHLTLQLDILKHIIGVKMAEDEARANRRARAAKRQQLQALLLEKEAQAMNGLSLDQIRSQLAELDEEEA